MSCECRASFTSDRYGDEVLILDTGTYIIQNVQLSDRYVELTGATAVQALRNDDSNNSDTQRWVVTQTDGGYTLKSAAGESYLGIGPGQSVLTQSTPTVWAIVADTQSDRFHITTADGTAALSCPESSLGSAPGTPLVLRPTGTTDDAARWWFQTQYPPGD